MARAETLQGLPRPAQLAGNGDGGGYGARPSKEENTVHVSTLGLTEYVNELNLTNTRYQTLTDQRTQSRETAKTDNSKTIRTEMDALYDYLSSVAFCMSVVTPTEDTARFVTPLNAIIDETNTVYNQRIAQVKAAEERRKVKAE